MIKNYKKKYKKLENSLDIHILPNEFSTSNRFYEFFMIFCKTNIFRSYFCLKYLGIIISYKSVNSKRKIEYFYDYVHNIHKKYIIKIENLERLT